MSDLVMRPGVRADVPTDEDSQTLLLMDNYARRETVAVINEGRLVWSVMVFPPGDAPIPMARVAQAVEDAGGAAWLEICEVIEVGGLPTFEDAARVANAIRSALR